MWPFSKINRLNGDLNDAHRKIALLEKRTIWLEKYLAGDQRKIAELMRRIEVLQGRKI